METYNSYNVLLNTFRATIQTGYTNIIRNQLRQLCKYKRMPRKLKKYWKTKTIVYELYIWVKKYNVDPNNIQIEINRLPLYSFEKGNNNEIT